MGCTSFAGGLPQPPVPLRPARPGASDFTAVCGWRWRRCVEVFLQIFQFVPPGSFASRRLPAGQDGVIPVPTLGFAAACRMGATIASCLRNVLPQTPSLLPVARDGSVRYCTSRLFYGSWAFERITQTVVSSKHFCLTGLTSPTCPTNLTYLAAPHLATHHHSDMQTHGVSHDAPTFS